MQLSITKTCKMIHLAKQTTTAVQGIQLNRLACVNNPFIKGLILSKDDFSQRLNKNPEFCCKKCTAIFNKIK